MKKLLAASCILLASTSASALELDFDGKYLLGNIGSTSHSDVDESSIGFGIGAGIPLKGLDLGGSTVFIEAGYNSLGEIKSQSSSAMYGAGRLSFAIQEKFSVYGKLGMNYFMSDIKDKDGSINLLWGAGAGYQLTDALEIAGEYGSFESDFTTFSGNVRFKF